MREEQHRFLMIHGQLPMRLSIQQASWVLNCGAHDIPVLMAARLLKPLGRPPLTGSKYFATGEILALARDRAWLVKMTNALYQFWRTKNAGRKKTTVMSGKPPK